jgi:AcrR family transcriptional regulator
MNDEIKGNLPEGIAISWGLGKKPQRGPKREMSTDQIVKAAIKIADQDGLAALSMSRLASSLGFTTMSLYRYIPSKDDLFLLMQDAVCAMSFTENGDDAAKDWRQRMRDYVNLNISFFRKHPWITDIPISGVPVTPNQLKLVDLALRSTRGLPINDYEKMSFVLLLSGYARSCGVILKDMDKAIESGKSPDSFSGTEYSSALKNLVTAEQFPDLYPVLLSGAYTEENEEDNTVGDDFAFGLERILDGIEQFLSLKK